MIALISFCMMPPGAKSSVRKSQTDHNEGHLHIWKMLESRAVSGAHNAWKQDVLANFVRTRGVVSAAAEAVSPQDAHWFLALSLLSPVATETRGSEYGPMYEISFFAKS